jgi:hypothetical protein
MICCSDTCSYNIIDVVNSKDMDVKAQIQCYWGWLTAVILHVFQFE